MTEKQTLFLEWLNAEEDVYIHPSLSFQENKNRSGSRIITSSTIPKDTIVMKIPKSSLLSRRNTAISNLLDDEPEMVALVVTYLWELSQGSESPWSTYLNTVPSSVPVSKLWTAEEQRMLLGTEVDRIGGLGVTDYTSLYNDSILPFIKTNEAVLGEFRPTREEVYRGLSVLESRAFDTDEYHGYSLVPFADALDHDVYENVHFQTDIDVCRECGSLRHCEHTMSDSDESDDESDDDDEVPCCEFITIKDIQAGEEVINTYGRLPNAVLLSRYGFATIDNPYDEVALTLLDSTARGWFDLNGRNLRRALQKQGHFSKARLGNESDTESDDDEEEDDYDVTDQIYLTSQGRPSHDLLLYLLISTISSLKTKTGPEVKVQMEMLVSAWEYIQPGRMPLQRFLFMDSINALSPVITQLDSMIDERTGRYTIPLALNDIQTALIALPDTLSDHDKNLKMALIVRHNETSILTSAKEYLSCLGRAIKWLNDRSMLK